MQDNPETIEDETRTPTLKDAFNLGISSQYIRLEADAPIGGEESYLFSALKQTRELMANIDLDMEHIEREITNKMEGIEKNYELPTDEELSDRDQARLKKEAESWIKLMRQSLKDEKLIRVVNKGFFDARKAMESPEKLFEQEIWENLPNRTRKDISEASQALAVGCTTSTVFLSLRAVEDRLRALYEHQAGESVEKEGWFHILDKLESEFDKDRPPVLSNLDYLRNKRNEIAHPDYTPDWNEAASILHRISSIISEIHTHMDPLDEEKYEEILKGSIVEIKEELSELETVNEELLLEIERENKNRKTLKKWLKERTRE